VTETPTTIGAYLRAARITRRIGIQRAAEETKIRAEYLTNIESDRLDFLAPAYVRGFIRTYASFLRVEPDPLLHEFDRLYFSVEEATGTEVAVSPRSSRTPAWFWTAVTVAAGVAVLALAVQRLLQGGP
jgi:cytoskeleton protein RodZ